MSSKNTVFIRAAALYAMLTVGVMAVFFNLYDPWIAAGPDRMMDGGFETEECLAEWTGWNSDLIERSRSGGFKRTAGVILETEQNRNSSLRMVVLDTDHLPSFRLSVRAAAENVQPGEKDYHLPRTVLVYMDRTGKPMYHIKHNVFSLKDDARWKRYTQVFPVPEGSREAHIHLSNLGRGGTLYIDDISLVPVKPRPSTLFFHGLLTLLWISALTVCLIALKPWSSLTGIGTLLCALIIIIGVLSPRNILDETISDTAEKTKSTLQQLSPAPDAPHPDTDVAARTEQKTETPLSVRHQTLRVVENFHVAGHFLLFMLLAILAIVTWAPGAEKNRHITHVTAGLILFAASTEVLQFITPDRKPGLDDLATDVGGIVAALLVTGLLTLPARLRRTRQARGLNA